MKISDSLLMGVGLGLSDLGAAILHLTVRLGLLSTRKMRKTKEVPTNISTCSTSPTHPHELSLHHSSKAST